MNVSPDTMDKDLQRVVAKMGRQRDMLRRRLSDLKKVRDDAEIVMDSCVEGVERLEIAIQELDGAIDTLSEYA